ncbi:MAG: hypothetical protein WB816_03710 [Methylocystis sp.]
MLRVREATIFAASDFAEAETLMKRVRREILGELNVDADKDMDSLELLISSIEQRLIGKEKREKRARS